MRFVTPKKLIHSLINVFIYLLFIFIKTLIYIFFLTFEKK